MVSKITSTLAILLIIGFINKSHAVDDARKEKLMKENKMQCFHGIERNPKNVSEFSKSTKLMNCSDRSITMQDTSFDNLEKIGCYKITSTGASGNSTVQRGCYYSNADKCDSAELLGMKIEMCICNKDGCNSSSSIHFNIVFLFMSFAIVYFFAYN